MITGDMKNKIDKLWEEFWTGGIANPLSVIEQISFLMFSRMLDVRETRNLRKAERTKAKVSLAFGPDEQDLRWSQFRHWGDSQKMLVHVRDKVFPHFQKVAMEGTRFGEYMKDAQLLIQKPRLLVSAVNTIDELPLTEGDRKGDLYEYLLGKLTTAGINGQFRTPRHIIKMMVDLVDPKKDEMIGDPACGTAGFLVEALQHILERNTSPEGVIVSKDEKGDENRTYTGDQLEAQDWDHLRRNAFHGYDFDITMLRIAAMNLLLHDVDAPDIHYQDTLSTSFTDRFPKQAADQFDVILANPPFKGSLDDEDVHSSLLSKVKTKKTELLFVALILRMLKLGGRCAMIVPDGVLFGSSKAHLALRQMLVEDNQLEAVISLPSGVFKPYAGVSTAVLVFTKGGKTEHVFYYDVENDGFSLDDKRLRIEANDLPDVAKRWTARSPKEDRDRGDKAFFVSAGDIRATKSYDLSIRRYKEVRYDEASYDSPRVILERLRKLEHEIWKGLDELEEMIPR